jgi:hypothetical protein
MRRLLPGSAGSSAVVGIRAFAAAGVLAAAVLFSNRFAIVFVTLMCLM